MDDRQKDFIETFREFLESINRERSGVERLTPLGRIVEHHLGAEVRTLPTVSEKLPEHRLVDADIAVSLLAEGGRLVGVSGGHHREMEGLAGLLSSPHFQYDEGPIDYREVSSG